MPGGEYSVSDSLDKKVDDYFIAFMRLYTEERGRREATGGWIMLILANSWLYSLSYKCTSEHEGRKRNSKNGGEGIKKEENIAGEKDE